MPLSDDALGGLTAAEADLRERELRQTAEDDEVRIAVMRVPEPSGLVTLSWRVVAAAAAGVGVAGSIRAAAATVGVDERLLGAIAFLESGFKPGAGNPGSSARGLFQFIDSTWDDMVRQFGAALGVGAGDRDELRAQCMMGAKLLSLNLAALQRKLGHRPTPGQCYAGHLMGVAAAAALALGDQAEAVDAALARFYAGTSRGAGFAAKVVAANAPIFRDHGVARSCGGVQALLDAKVATGLQQAEALFGALPESVAALPVSGDPAWLGVARAELSRGVAELPGAASNPRIEEYFTYTRLGQQPDGVAWCGAFASYCLGVTNQLRRGTGSARAADWAGFGDALAAPRPGCIAVLEPLAAGASGHVAFWLETKGGMLRLLGGNQGDRVSIESFPQAKLRGFRWPSASV